MAGQKSKKYKVLIVDDEKKILTVAKKLLSSEGYEVLTTDNAEEALDILEERGPIAVVLSDNRMPAMRGTEFFKKIKTICPNTVRILMTAYYDSQLIEDIVNAGEVYRYLKKPLDFKLVSQTIQAGIQQYERNLEVEALGEDLLRLNHEKTELESTSASLDATINKLTRVKKFLVVSLIGMAVTFGIYQVFSAWSKRAVLEAGSVQMGPWVRYPNDTALDTRTGLMWMTQDYRILEGRAPGNWEKAMEWADKMNRRRFAGYDDWRIPTVEEYKNTFDPEAKKMAFDKNEKFPVGYPPPFEEGGGYAFWSRDEVGLDSARYYFYVGGYSKTVSKSYNNATVSVRLVRE